MTWPTDIIAREKGRILEVAYDDGVVVRLTAEKLRVESPSAEVQGHSPSQRKLYRQGERRDRRHRADRQLCRQARVRRRSRYRTLYLDISSRTRRLNRRHARDTHVNRDKRLRSQMNYEFQGHEIEATSSGYLVNLDDWSQELAEHIARLDKIELGPRHWDVIAYLQGRIFQQQSKRPQYPIAC